MAVEPPNSGVWADCGKCSAGWKTPPRRSGRPGCPPTHSPTGAAPESGSTRCPGRGKGTQRPGMARRAGALVQRRPADQRKRLTVGERERLVQILDAVEWLPRSSRNGDRRGGAAPDHPAGTGTRPAAGLRRCRGHAPGSRQGPRRPVLRPPRDGVSELDARVQRLLAAERRAVGGAVAGRVPQLAEPLHDEECPPCNLFNQDRRNKRSVTHAASRVRPCRQSGRVHPAVFLSLPMPTPGRHRTARWTAHLLRALRRRRVSRSIREGPRRCASAIRDRPP